MTELTCVRAMLAADADAVVALVRLAFAAQSVATDPPASALRLTGDDVVTHLRTGGGAVAACGATLVGSVMWSDDSDGRYISRLAIRPDWRRRGLARALIAAAEDAARADGRGRLHLGTRLVLHDNRRLFAACGFAEVSCHAHPGYSAPTWVTMAKRLD